MVVSKASITCWPFQRHGRALRLERIRTPDYTSKSAGLVTFESAFKTCEPEHHRN
jgi:hypothetical protein